MQVVICFDCSQETKRHLDALLRSGGYADYGDAIAAAVANQAVLNERVTKGGAMVVSEGGVGEPYAQRFLVPRERPWPPRGRAQRDNVEPTALPGIHPLLLRQGLDTAVIDPAPLPDSVWSASDSVPVNRWVFGQHNRFLPAKVTCRALARLLLDAPGGVLLSDAAPKIADAAVDLGDYLVNHDLSNGLTRDEATAIAFPHSGHGLWKGRLRFANQFVGSVNSDGQLTGMPIELRLVNVSGRKDNLKLKLTDVGWKLAVLENPMLDGPARAPAEKLSTEERSLLLEHIARNVRAEDFAYRTLLAAIENGASTPDRLDNVLRSMLGPTGADVSDAFLNTQRTGAISRMADLGLVTRKRSGLLVDYELDDRGREYLRSKEGAPHV